MRIAIVHFHLQTGGITRVIAHACAALNGTGRRIVVLSGAAPARPLPQGTAVRVVPELGYQEWRPRSTPADLARAMSTAARAALGGEPDLWHVHNHALGKNLALPGALRCLAAGGQRLLLQLHDFTEDGRPALYRRMLQQLAAGDGARLAALLYPLAPQVHYAVLSARDHDLLASAGVPGERLHRLPNAAAFDPPPTAPRSAQRRAQPPAGDDRRLWLYPTRAIRRKNLGELLLWAALAGPDTCFGATQAPQNPAEQPRYRRWKALAQALRLPAAFELGAGGGDFAALLGASHALLTTSVAEGFGLAFLEPWLIGRPLAGRDLPEVTRDLTAAGLDLGALYTRLPVPLAWIDAAALRRRLDIALQHSADAYARARPADDLARAWGAATDGERIDFGRLDEPAQEQVIRRVAADAHAACALDATEPPLAPNPARLAANRAVVERDFLLGGYRRRLEAVYAAVAASAAGPITGRADGAALLERCQRPERFHLLRT